MLVINKELVHMLPEALTKDDFKHLVSPRLKRQDEYRVRASCKPNSFKFLK